MRERRVRTPERIPEKLVLHWHGNAIEGGKLVRCAVDHTFGARAIVATDIDDQRIVQLAQVFDCLDDAADLIVGIGEVGPINIRLLDEELLLQLNRGNPSQADSPSATVSAWRFRA